VTLTILAFVVVFVGISAAVTLVIQRSSQRVDIDISDFQDINLTEILNVQKRNESALEAALRQLADLERARVNQIQIIEDDIDGRVELVSNGNLSVGERTRRINDLRSEESALIAGVGREFDPQIEEKRAEIDAIQERIDEYDSRLIEEARRTEATLLQLETLVIARYEYLWTELAARVNTKNGIIADRTSTIADQSELIDRYSYSIENLARDSRANGYVLDARNMNDILVHINPSLPPLSGSIGYVFRDVDDFIGEIRVDGNRAELVQLANANRAIRPFDIFLIQLQ